MKNQNIRTVFSRTLIAAALATGVVGAAQAISVNADLGVTTQVLSDTGLTSAVQAKLATDARVKGADINVATQSGVIVLTGTAPNADAKIAAEQLARAAYTDAAASANAKADVKIDNRIQVPGLMGEIKSDVKSAASSTGEVVTDSWISTKIKSQLLADTATKGTAIKVTTRDNIVFLRGTVASKAEKDQAIALAQATEGVKRVNASKLKVSARANANADVKAQ